MITISDSAVTRVNHLRQKKNAPDLQLRITITAGGCSGFNTQFSLEHPDAQTEHDRVFDAAPDVHIVVDDAALDLIDGSHVHFKTSLMGSAFVLENPQATATCGCGTSFALG